MNLILRTISRGLGLKKLEDRIRSHRLNFQREARSILRNGAYFSAHSEDARARLNALGPSPTGIALVGPLPPDDTGVSSFGFNMATECPGSLDLFATFPSPSDYYGTLAQLGGAAELFPLEMLSLAAQTRSYSAVVFAIANSNHMPPIADRLLSFEKLGQDVEIVAEVHDPVLFNLTRRVFASRSDLDNAYARAYPRLEGRQFTHLDDQELLKLGIAGFSALFAGKVDRIVVHSKAARDILLEDMKEIDAPPVIQLFHPVFRQRPPRKSSQLSFDRPALGTFGVPGHDKHSMEILEAARALLRDGVIRTFVIAGYGAKRMQQHLSYAERQAIQIFDSPSDEELGELMKTVDVAVQLRKRALGESSGVIPQLLELRKPIVVSNIGSFREYPDMVTFCDVPVSTRTIQSAVVSALADGASTRIATVENYVESHRSEDFIAGLQTALKLPKDTETHKRQPIKTAAPVHIFGYYDHNNAGDDAFRLYFGSLFGPSAKFHGDSWSSRKVSGRIILGGGAVINKYFFERLPVFETLDIIGCSFSDRKGSADILASVKDRLGVVVLRSAKDAAGAREVGVDAQVFPDIVFGATVPPPSMTLTQVRALAQLPTLAKAFDRTIVIHLSDDYTVRNDNGHRRQDIDRFKTDLAQALDTLSGNYNIVMVPMSMWYRSRDLAFSHDVIARMKNAEKVTLVDRYLGPEGILKITSSIADIVISMKFHGLIFGMLCGKPIINVGDTTKTIDLMNESSLQRFDLGLKIGGDRLLQAAAEAFSSTEHIKAVTANYRNEVGRLSEILRQTYDNLERKHQCRDTERTTGSDAQTAR